MSDMIGGGFLGALADAAAKAKCIANPTMQCRIDAERGALQGLIFVPNAVIDWYQGERALLGFEPPTMLQSEFILPYAFIGVIG